MPDRSGTIVEAARGAGRAGPAEAEAALPIARVQRLEDDAAFEVGGTVGTAAAAARGPMPRRARRSSNERVEEAATRRFPEREAFGAIAAKGCSGHRDPLKTKNCVYRYRQGLSQWLGIKQQ